MQKEKMHLNSGIKTYQILTNDDDVCIPSLSSILIAVRTYGTTIISHLKRNEWQIETALIYIFLTL